MKKRSIYDYFGFGSCVRYLLDAREGNSIHGNGNVSDNLTRFFRALDALNLAVTKRAAANLLELRKEIAAEPSGSTLSETHATKLHDSIRSVRTTLIAELQGIEAFQLTGKVVDVTKLTGNVGSLFSPNVYSSLPELAKFDLAEAGWCIALERPTAAAFHLMRGTELVLREFYLSIVRQKRIKSRMWGPLLDDLRKRPKAKTHLTLINHLDHIRTSFRNPTQHPEKVYDIHEVQDLWSLCADAINRMQKHRIDAS